MMEFRIDDLPKDVKSKPLDLGVCPHGIPMVRGNKVYTDFPHLYWSFQRESGRGKETKSRDTEVSVKISLFWGLAQGSVDYQRHTSTSKNKDSIIIRSFCRVEKEVASLTCAKPISESRCSKDNCRFGPYYVDTVSIGAEAALTVYLDSMTETEESSSTVGGRVQIFGASLGDSIKSYASSYKGNTTLHATYTSSLGDTVELKPASPSESDIQKFVTDIQELEEKMKAFPETVTELNRTNKLHYIKYIFEPVARLSMRSIPDGLSRKLESRVKIEKVLQELLGVKEEAARIGRNRSLEQFVRDISDKIERLEQMRRSDNDDIERVKQIYGNHALNFYKRELKRLTKTL